MSYGGGTRPRLLRASRVISGKPGVSGQQTFAILMGHTAVKGQRVRLVHIFEVGVAVERGSYRSNA